VLDEPGGHDQVWLDFQEMATGNPGQEIVRWLMLALSFGQRERRE
jgi:hypothetical protein